MKFKLVLILARERVALPSSFFDRMYLFFLYLLRDTLRNLISDRHRNLLNEEGSVGFQFDAFNWKNGGQESDIYRLLRISGPDRVLFT